jgi:cation-transporting P-type ATPase I
MSLGTALVLAAMIQTPGVSRFFDCTPLGPVAWTVVLVCSVGATVASVARPRLASRRAASLTAGPTAPKPGERGR